MATKQAQNFVNSLSSYLVDTELSDVDRRKIAHMFERHTENIVITKVITRREKSYNQPRTRTEYKYMGKPNVKPQVIIDYVAEKFNLFNFNNARTRRGQYPAAKFMAMVLMDKCTHLTLKDIGSHFLSPYTSGTIDHTTVIHGLREGRNMIDTIPYYADIYYEFFKIHNITDHADINIAITTGSAGDTGLPGIGV